MTRMAPKTVAKKEMSKQDIVKEKLKKVKDKKSKKEEVPVEDNKKSKKKSKGDEAVDELVEIKKGKKKAVKVVDAIKEKKSKKEEAKAILNCAVDYGDVMDGIEKKYDTGSSQLTSDPRAKLSIGLLSLDLLLNGGVLGGGWYTFFGQEQSAKSTLAMLTLVSALNTDVPLLGYYDYEGSSSYDYISNIMKSMNVKGNIENIFGLRDDEGHWLIKPRVRYYQPSTAEAFFDSVAKLLRALPDIKMIGDKQYYVYPDEKTVRAKIKTWDEKLLKKTGQLYVETSSYIKHQAIFVVDSYPAMLPEKQDEDDPGSAMAVQARMFSEQIKRIKARLKPKKVTIIGINQIRLKPAVIYGSPEYEPCGEALKLFSDARIRCASRSIPHGKGAIEEEPSATGEGIDTYRYVAWRTQKNKLGGIPNSEAWGRIWVSNNEGQGCGFCPVFDVYEFLKMTGQISGSRNKLVLTIPQFKGLKAKLSWMQFKVLVIGKKEQVEKVYKQIGYKDKYFNLRKECFKQFEKGVATKMYLDKKVKNVDAKGDEDED
jgi:RecA/RadA recombinase